MPVRWTTLGLFCALLSVPQPGALAAETEVSSSVPIAEAQLEYRETSNSLANWSIDYTRVAQPFPKEPAVGARKVVRGMLRLSGAPGEGQEVGCLWDYRQGKLYLDLNGNRDLTDDSGGVSTTTVPRFYYGTHTFTNVHLQVRTPRGAWPLCLDLHLYNPDGPRVYVTASCRSFWEGKLTLQGRDWQVGRIESQDGSSGVGGKGYLVLRPWEQREAPFEVGGGSLETFGFPDNLFFGGHAYAVECILTPQEGKPGCKLTFREVTASLGELKLTGRFIDRLLLLPKGGDPKDRFTVVLDHPDGVVKVPVGDYQSAQVQLKAGKAVAYREGYPGDASRQGFEVAAGGEPQVVDAGGPLTNTVSVQRQGRNLSLSYRLIGADGVAYALASQNRADPPHFVISRGGKTIHSGRFEFG